MKKYLFNSSVLLLWFLIGQTFAQNSGGTFVPGPTLNKGRIFSMGTLMANGKAIYVGGRENGFVSSSVADLYDPATNQFTEVNMNGPHDMFAMTKLTDGRYLISGGCFNGGVPSYNECEIYNPNTNTFSSVAPMNYGRMMNSGAQLASGKVLIAGGWYSMPAATNTELYDVATNQWATIGTLNTPRAYPIILPTSDSGAVICGGFGVFGGASYAHVESYNKYTNAFTAVSVDLNPEDPGWIPLSNQTKPVEDYRLANGNFLVPANKNTGSGTDFALFLFNPTNKSFTRFQTSSPLVSDITDGGWIDVVLNKAENLVYIAAIDNGFDPQRVSIITVNMTTGEVAMPSETFQMPEGEYLYPGMTYLPATAQIISVGVNGPNPSNFTATNKTYLITPGAQVGTKADLNQANFLAYPNPSSDFAFLQLEQGSNADADIQLTDARGQTRPCPVDRTSKNGLVLNIGQLENGLYFLKVRQGNRQHIQKILKN